MESTFTLLALLLLYLLMLLVAFRQKDKVSLIFTIALTSCLSLHFIGDFPRIIAFYGFGLVGLSVLIHGILKKGFNLLERVLHISTGLIVFITQAFIAFHLQGLSMIHFFSLLPILLWLIYTLKRGFKKPQWTYLTAMVSISIMNWLHFLILN